MKGRIRSLAIAFIVTLAFGVPARAAEPIKIGFSMSLTGGLAGGGKSALLAIQMWAEDVNAKGGLLGRPVQLVFYDDQTNASQVPAIYTKLLEIDKVDLVISAYATNQIAPAMPIVMQRNLVFMALFGTGVNDTFNYPRYFQILPNGENTKLAPSLGFLETAMTMNPPPQTIALVGADAEYAQTVLAGARETVQHLGLKVVYDKSYPPNTVDFSPVVRAIQAANPDVIFVASYPPDSVGMVRAANEVGLKARMFGGGMIGLAFTPIKLQLGHLLNGIVAYDVYEPEPTMKFPGVEEFVKRYQERAPKEGVDPLGYYLPPFAYSEMQVLGEAVTQVGSLDQGKIADYIHKTTFHTIVGDVTFAPNGEWAKSRVLFVQYRDIKDNDVEQFRQGGKTPILYPPEYKTGDLVYPYSDIKR
ncbi:MAG TPA: amino acid ABC transporter substrate-binding protein [Stellaceae bacterium]|nr:amino acid ABC transporter substrate-binding protein [Stellaceae bacterium]